MLTSPSSIVEFEMKQTEISHNILKDETFQLWMHKILNRKQAKNGKQINQVIMPKKSVLRFETEKKNHATVIFSKNEIQRTLSQAHSCLGGCSC
jgi:hypothetical protein